LEPSQNLLWNRLRICFGAVSEFALEPSQNLLWNRLRICFGAILSEVWLRAFFGTRSKIHMFIIFGG